MPSFFKCQEAIGNHEGIQPLKLRFYAADSLENPQVFNSSCMVYLILILRRNDTVVTLRGEQKLTRITKQFKSTIDRNKHVCGLKNE